MESTHGEVIQYRLPLGEHRMDMNQLVGQEISMEYLGRINCIRCGRETRRSFAQGYCYPCFKSAPETEECVLRPELCRAHEGVARDMDYAREHCLNEHVVYLAFTSGLKVGVTRLTQVPTRWIDQGAVRSIELARTPNRYTAGMLEVAMKDHIQDRTNWRKMLSGSDPGDLDLVSEKARLAELVPAELRQYVTKDHQVLELVYPVSKFPEKIKSLDFEKEPLVSGILMGIKGQYLMFEGNRVINIRKYGGYYIRLQAYG
ncbi:MAG: DUF2797 domain-containing protein [Bacteroidales bacterium]|nr:DUF2797 domain-containing protein [Bacteroidales bacterium]